MLKSNSIIYKNIYLLIIRLIVILFIYQLCRIFYLFYNIDYFININHFEYFKIIIGSLKFDISAILYSNLLVIFLSLFPSKLFTLNRYKKLIAFIFIFCNFITITTNIFDTFYYPFTKNRFTLSIFKEFSNENNIIPFIKEFGLDYWYAIPILFSLLYILKYITKKTTLESKNIHYNFSKFITSLVIAIFCFTLTVYGCRGSFIYKNRPITISNAGKYTNNPNEIPLIINTPFSLFRTAHIKDLKRKQYFDKNEIQKHYNIKKQFKGENIKKKNIVIIILESMGTEYFGFYNDYKKEDSFTPFLDSLLQYSYTSYNSFANGKKSIDAMPAILASIPNTNIHFSLTKYCTNNIKGLAHLLKNINYTTSFFHGAPNGSMGFESMAKICGLENYYGMNEYNNNKDFDGLWGIWDDKFFNYFATKLNTMQEPFLSTIFSSSSHHPYKIPKQYKNKFKKGKHPMHECVQYTDYSLKLFFNQIEREEWYKNTLFVITADHTNISMEKKYKTSLGIFRVPIIFFDPSNTMLAQKSDDIIQHIDIMPSILSYINYPKPFMSFGNNIFKKERVDFAINYHNAYQLIIENKLLIYSDLQKKIIRAYDIENDKLMQNNILQKIKKETKKEYLNKIRAFQQLYNNNMIDNKLVYED